MGVWFVTLAVLGLHEIVGQPRDPGRGQSAVRPALPDAHGWHAFVVLGSVVLAVTGGEALYADMGHFGKRPIRLAWFGLVLPALVLNYFGQGALLLCDARRGGEPLLPAGAGLGAAAHGGAGHRRHRDRLAGGDLGGVLHDPAGGAAGLLAAPGDPPHLGRGGRPDLHPARQLGALVGVVVLVLGFQLVQRPGRGLRHRGDRHHGASPPCWRWWWRAGCGGWQLSRCLALGAFFLAVDLAFFGANLLKIPSGGWFPLAVGCGIFLLMATWKRRSAHPVAPPGRGLAAARPVPQAPEGEPDPAGGGHRGIHDRQPRQRPHRPAT